MQNESILTKQLARAAGIDVHTKAMNVCVISNESGIVFKTFGTYTGDLYQLRDWLKSMGIKDAVMESTGIYWIPLFTILEAAGIAITLANPLQVKQIPGRKTDTSDSQWLCQLLIYGLVKGSFIPTSTQKDLRDLNRQRFRYVYELSRTKARVVKLLETCNYKIREVLSNINTKSTRAICESLSTGERSAEQLCKCLRGKARSKKELLLPSLDGVMNETQQFEMGMFLKDWAHYELQIAVIENAMQQLVEKHYQSTKDLLQTLPGVAQTSVYSLLAEIGDNVKCFKKADNLTAWAGLAPGNKQSGSKWYSQPIRKGNKYVSTILIQIAWAAVRVKNSYWQAQFIWLKRKLPVKKALVAIARKYLKLIYNTLSTRQEYVDKGAAYFLEQLSFRRNNFNNQAAK